MICESEQFILICTLHTIENNRCLGTEQWGFMEIVRIQKSLTRAIMEGTAAFNMEE